MSRIEFFVVHLPSQTHRRVSIAAEFRKIGIDPEFIPALDGHALDAEAITAHYSQAQALEKIGRALSPGEIGCVLSHQWVYRKMIRENLPAAVIVEDDASFGDEFLELYAAVRDRVLTPTAEAILFSRVEKYSNWGRERIRAGCWLVRPTKAVGSHCYLLNLAAAVALLRANYPVYRPPDRWIGFLREGVVRVRAIVPYCAGLAACGNDSMLKQERRALMPRPPSRHSEWWIIVKYIYRKLVCKLVYNPLNMVLMREKKQKITW